MNHRNFSLEDFKKWMMEQQDAPSTKNFVGTEVISKVSLRRLKDQMHPEDGELDDLAEAFKEEGGTVMDVDGKTFIVEVNCGTFSIPRQFVTRA